MSEDLLHKSVLTKSQLEILQSMCNSKLGNYAGIPGLTSSLLGGPTHGKVRLFECSRAHQESLVPHSHRFDVMCLVLRGYVDNHIWRKSTHGDEFMPTRLSYLGAPGTHQRFPEGAESYVVARYVRDTTRYDHGEFYNMKATDIHSIDFSRDAVVLFFEGPELTTDTVILEPFVDGKVVPTFNVQPWMYQPEHKVTVAA
jgi:hypothetical protein